MFEMAVEELFAKFGSEVVEVTEAVLLEDELALKVLAVALMVMRMELPTPRLPSEQLTVPALKEQEPCAVEEET